MVLTESLERGISGLRLPPKPKAARHKLQRKKLHPAVRMGIPCLPQVYGQGLRWEQSATELSLVGTTGPAGPLL